MLNWLPNIAPLPLRLFVPWEPPSLLTHRKSFKLVNNSVALEETLFFTSDPVVHKRRPAFGNNNKIFCI